MSMYVCATVNILVYINSKKKLSTRGDNIRYLKQVFQLSSRTLH